jgi:hypothetical protein
VTALDVSGCSLRSGGIAAIADYRSLVELALRDTTVDDSDVKYLLAARSLKWLSCNGTRLTFAGVRKLAAHPSVEELAICGIDINTETIKELLSSCTLQKVIFDEHIVSRWKAENGGVDQRWQIDEDAFVRQPDK